MYARVSEQFHLPIKLLGQLRFDSQGGKATFLRSDGSPPTQALGTFDEHLGGRAVGAAGVRGQAGVAPRVVLESLGNDQAVQVAPVPEDLDVGTAV